MRDAITETGIHQVDANASTLKHKVRKVRLGKLDFGESQHRACPGASADTLHKRVSLSYLALTDGPGRPRSVAFRVESERELENDITRTSYTLLGVITIIVVLASCALYAYLEAFVYKRLKKMRRYVTKLSYNDDSGIFDDFDDSYDYFADGLDGLDGDLPPAAAGDPNTRDEINRLKFMTRKRIEFLKRRHSDALASLVSQKEGNAAVSDSVRLVSLVRGRAQKQFFANLPHFPREAVQGYTLRRAFETPVALEMFKDYCARNDQEALQCIFFVLDVTWIKILEEMYPKRRGAYSPITVSAARTVGRNYFANKAVKGIEFKKSTKNKILKLPNYEPGMYDKALEEAAAKVEIAFENYRDTREFLDMMYVSDVFYGNK